MDSYILTGPNGSQINVGSYLLADPGPDFGAKDLLKAEYAETPLAEGGLLVGESVGVRNFTFPLRLASSVPSIGGLPGLEAWMRSLARPGAYIDLMPHGVATGDAVRFDILSGRYEESYSLPFQKIARRDGTLVLGVEPYGYLPTWRTLASAASVGLPGMLQVPGGSVMGDVPGLAVLIVQASTPTQYSAGTYLQDMIAWSMDGRPSTVAFIPPASIYGGTNVGDKYAVASQAHRVYLSDNWNRVAYSDVLYDVEPAYRGQYRAFAWLKQPLATPTAPLQVALDVIGVNSPLSAFASARPVATACGAPGAVASPAYGLVDLGALTLPHVGSGIWQGLTLRLWVNPGPTNYGAATRALDIGGFYLLPADSEMGFLSSGLSEKRLTVDSHYPGARLSGQNSDFDVEWVDGEAAQYRGVLPKVTDSTVRVDLLAGARATPSGPMVRMGPSFASVSLTYRPRFRFLRSI